MSQLRKKDTVLLSVLYAFASPRGVGPPRPFDHAARPFVSLRGVTALLMNAQRGPRQKARPHARPAPLFEKWIKLHALTCQSEL